MVKKLTFFQPVGDIPWPPEIVVELGGKVDSSGNAVFGPGSTGAVERFEKLAADRSWGFVRMNIPRATKSEIANFPYVYLPPKYLSLKANQNLGDFFLPGSGCDVCGAGWVQVRKLRFCPSWTKPGLDILCPSTGLGRPMVVLASRRLALAIRKHGFTGVDMIPCISPEERFSDEIRWGVRSKRLENEAAFFQLRVQSSLPAAFVGEAHRSGQCGGTCGSEYFVGESMGVFQSGDFSGDSDFYSFYRYRDDRDRLFLTSGEGFAASTRFYEFFNESGFKGWAPYMTDPRIEVGVVEIAD